MTARVCDVIVVGAGPAGEVAAGALAERGCDVVLVERELVGGECSSWACMPSKALLRPGELAAETRRVDGVADAAVDPPAALRRRDEIVHGWDDRAQLPWLEERGIALVRGSGRLVGVRRVAVAGADGADLLLEARRAVVLATGSGAAIPPVEGLPEARPWTNREATSARAAPGRLLVLGGGVVGVELAQAWARLGSAVTVVERGARLLAGEEPAASAAVADGLRRSGVDVRCGVAAAAARRDDDGTAVLALADGAQLRADELLVAAGRVPRTAGLGLEALGLQPDRPIPVDDRLRVPGHDWLYAIGDVAGLAQLTHEGKRHGRIVADVIAGGDAALRDDGPPPRVVFTDPTVAAVGHTLASARDAGLPAVAVDGRIDATPGASFRGPGADAFARWVVDEDRRVLLGATFVAPDAAELLHAATVAVVGAVPVDRLADATPPFPTRAEAWLELAAWADRTRRGR